jgi:hypothetical protein
MGKWVLDTHTKGTGANMVPLDSVLRSGSDAVPGFKLPERKRIEEQPPEPRAHRFRIVDVMTRRVLADDVGAREAVAALATVRSIVDVTVSVWDDQSQRWRMLSFAERRALWDHRGRVAATGHADPPITPRTTGHADPPITPRTTGHADPPITPRAATAPGRRAAPA